MVKGRSAMHLDGDFAGDFPSPERFTLKRDDEWTVIERGPRYVNSIEVTEFDAQGLAWLERMRRT